MKRRFVQCDVFSATPYYGNPLAVVIDGAGLSDLQMQNFSSWTNLSETTFLMPPEDPLADYKVRIFTPTFEMPFAGHPTLGSCAAWLDAGNTPKSNIAVVQECNIGLVSIDISKASSSITARFGMYLNSPVLPMCYQLMLPIWTGTLFNQRVLAFRVVLVWLVLIQTDAQRSNRLTMKYACSHLKPV